MRIVTKSGKWRTSEVEALFVPIAQNEKIPKGLPKLAEQLLKDAIKKYGIKNFHRCNLKTFNTSEEAYLEEARVHLYLE